MEDQNSLDAENLLDHDSLVKLSKEEIITYHLKVVNLSEAITNLNSTVKDLSRRLEKAEVTFEIASNANKLLKERVDHLEKRVVNNERTTINSRQYLRNRLVEVKGIKDANLSDKEADLKCKMAELLSLTGEQVIPADLDKCHMLGKSNATVIMKFHTREKRDAMLRMRKNLKGKQSELTEVNMGKAFIIESMTREYGLMDFICLQWKTMGEGG